MCEEILKISFDNLMKETIREYFIVGKTYKIKDELISWGCYWNKERKQWTIYCDQDDLVYKAIKKLGVDLI